MTIRIAGGRVIDPASGFDQIADLYLRDGVIAAVGGDGLACDQTMDAQGLVVCPGLFDLHVHLREPGGEHKETIATGTRAALRGGVTTVVAMPNTSPVCDCPEVLAFVRERARRADGARVLPAAAISVGQGGHALTDFALLQKAGAAALSDDGRPVEDDALMRRALLRAYELGLPVLSHCEPETENARRDIRLSEETGCPVHLCHISRRETVEAVRSARARGVKVTAETCPHYFLLTEEALKTFGPNAQMNPPLAAEDDRQAILDGLRDGTISCITTDHAPHTQAEKQSAHPPNGIVGLETLLAASLTALYHTGRLLLPELLKKLTAAPADILGVPLGRLTPGAPADVLLFDPDEPWIVRAEDFASKSRNTPFEGMMLRGRAKRVLVGGIEKEVFPCL